MKEFEVWGIFGATLFPCAVMLGGAALTKLRSDVRIFEAGIEKYQLVPRILLPTVARLVIALEIATTLLVLIPVCLDITAYFLIIMGFMFSIAQFSAMVRKFDISCGCFGAEGSKIGLNTIFMPISLLIVGIFIWIVIQRVDHGWDFIGLTGYYVFGVGASIIGVATFKTLRYGDAFNLKIKLTWH